MKKYILLFLFVCAHRTTLSMEKSSPETKIQDWKAVQEFVGCVVAYKTASMYLGTNIAGKELGYTTQDGYSFAYIPHAEPSSWISRTFFNLLTDEKGYSLYRVLLPGAVQRTCGLTDSEIAKTPLYMRKITKDESLTLLAAITAQKAVVEHAHIDDTLADMVSTHLMEVYRSSSTESQDTTKK